MTYVTVSRCLLAAVAVVSFDKNLDRSESAPETGSKWRYIRRFLDWFCGLESAAVSAPKQKTRLRDMTSLHQTPRARAALYTALTILITLDLLLYVFFSSGSDFGLLRNSPPFEVYAGNSTTIPMSGDHVTVLLNYTLSL